MRLFAIAATLFTASLALAQIVETPIPGDPVKLPSGQISGKILPSGVRAYFGIPFAQPPVGNLRWREPQPAKPWKGVYHADRMMPECIQVLRPHNINHYFGEEPTSENCLYLNIWAPPNATPTAALPVIVFIYGGGNTIGSAGMPVYGGETVAQRAAIFVNLNYRLGALGFMAHPELTKESPHHQSGNYAHLDQIAALQWIHDNIAAFGGDPAKVVISGQSAGAGAVSVLQASPLAKGLFRGVVAMSGGAWGTGGDMRALADAEKAGLEMQHALKAKSLDDMRQIPADRILAQTSEFQVGATGGAVRVGGANVDGYFMPDTPRNLFAAHKQNDVPLITGFTHDESSNALRTARTVDDYIAAAKKMYAGDAEAFLKLYPVKAAGEISEAGGAAARDGQMGKSARNWAMAQTKSGSAPVYLFLYSRVHPYAKGVHLADQDPATIGAYHTSDVPYWFGTQDAFNSLRITREWQEWDRELSKKMTALLVNFAKTGNPGTEWPQWKPGAENIIEFANQISVRSLDTPRMEFMAAHTSGSFAPTTGR